MTNKSDTPFTDAHEHNMGSVTEPHYVVDADKVSGLERELNALRAENERLNLELQKRDKCAFIGPMRDCPTHGDKARGG